MSSQSERRKFPRFSVFTPVSLSIYETKKKATFTATSLNMSLNGMLCAMDRYIPVSEKLLLTFVISESTQPAGHLSLQCGATVVQVTPQNEVTGQSDYTIALKFDTLSRTEQSILRSIISTARLSNLATSSVSVVIPVYNSQATLNELTVRIQSVLEPLVQCYEILLVNDGSRDDSWIEIIRLATRNANIRGFDLMRNYGQHNALLAGIQKARHEIIINLDDDLQHPPEEIPKLLTKFIEGYDVVYGKPAHREHSIWRNLSSKALKMVVMLVLGTEMGSHSSAFRVFRSTLRFGFERFTDVQLDIDVLLSWSASRVTHVFVDHQPRRYGKSGYNLRKLLLLTFSILAGYSSLPLRIASLVGFATSLFGLSMFFYVVIRRLLQTTYVPGFAFMASEVALFSGIQLFAIGVIGEYIARLHFRTMGKPPYVIREELE